MAGALSLNFHFSSHSQGGEARGLAAAFLIALALHAGALGLVVAWRSSAMVAPPGEQEITIDLAPEMVEAPGVAPAEASQPAGAPAEAEAVQPPVESATVQPAEQAVAPPPVEAAVPPPLTATPPIEMAQTVPAPAPASVPPLAVEAVLPPETRPIESSAIEALPLPPAEPPPPDPATVMAALPPPETVTARPVPEPRPAPKPVARRPAAQPARVPKPRPVEQAAPPDAAGPSASEASRPAESRENTGGAAAAADPDAMRRYAAQLAAALKRRLRYPEAARVAGATGSATMRFTLHRSGRVLAASIIRSAGHPALDQAALETVSVDASLPPAPKGVPQEQITFSVPLRFDMR